jgi:hypothetical protein
LIKRPSVTCIPNLHNHSVIKNGKRIIFVANCYCLIGPKGNTDIPADKGNKTGFIQIVRRKLPCRLCISRQTV